MGPPGMPPREAWPPPPVADDETTVASTSVFGNRVSNNSDTTPSYLLQHANQDQINALSELVLNLLKRRIPLTPPLMARLRRYKSLLRDVGKRRHSTKRRRALLMSQPGRGLWSGLKEACECVMLPAECVL